MTRVDGEEPTPEDVHEAIDHAVSFVEQVESDVTVEATYDQYS